jgi:hypothetical protein
MKKLKHPKLFETTIIKTDGSTYKKSWIFVQNLFELEIDINNNKKWKKNKSK